MFLVRLASVVGGLSFDEILAIIALVVSNPQVCCQDQVVAISIAGSQSRYQDRRVY